MNGDDKLEEVLLALAECEATCLLPQRLCEALTGNRLDQRGAYETLADMIDTCLPDEDDCDDVEPMGSAKPPEKRCENCRYWRESDYYVGAHPEIGECVRFPPMTGLRPERHANDVVWFFPETGKFATCGEWREDNGDHRWRYDD